MRRMSKFLILAIILCCIMLPALTACDNSNGSSASGGDKLVIYNWEDYIDESILSDFSAYYESVTGRSLSITYTTFDTNETMLTNILRGDSSIDLICPSEYAIEKLLRAGRLVNQKDLYAQLTPQLEEYGISLDNLSSTGNGYGNIETGVMEVITNMFGALENGNEVLDMTQYMVPYMWGTLGILYNTRIVSLEELEEYGWGTLWNIQNNPQLENKILMKDSVRDSYAAAVMFLYEMHLRGEEGYLPDGYEDYSIQALINCTDKAMLDAAERVLTEQRDHISGYEVDFGKDDMINEIVYADLAWSGDALWAIEEGGYDEETDTYQLGYFVPTSGSNIWYDGWAIPDTVKNGLAAMMFIDYMCNPASGALNSSYIGYTSAVARDKMMTDSDALSNLLDSEYLWCASSNECSLFTDADGNLLFRYQWSEEEEAYFLDAGGNEVEVEDESELTPFLADIDDEDYWLIDGETIIDPDSISEYFSNEGRYPEITDKFGIMRDYGAVNETVVQMWQRAKAGGISYVVIYSIIAVVGAVALILCAYLLKEYLKRRPRKIKK